MLNERRSMRIASLVLIPLGAVVASCLGADSPEPAP